MIDTITTYNGFPVFEVEMCDFTLIVDAMNNNKRLLSKNIENKTLKEYYVKERKPEFYVICCGVKVKYPI